uniref:Fasciculation and elongation protein zeta 1 n=2 Tax=Dromaius novaehollandiae TaxID=8790 RepID=A0A8C4KLM5_DRONO
MEAPLVSLEEEFEEGPGGGGGGGGPPRGPADPALAELESFSAEMMSFKSMEDLVQEFDEKLTVCFRNYDAATEALAPVRGRLQAQEEEERLQDEDQLLLLPPLPVAAPGGRATDAPTARVSPQLSGKEEEEEEDDEEEELTERSEHDSGINEEPLLTAEQVIEELEELMQSSPDPEADPEAEDEEEEEAEAELAGDGGGTEPILLRELRAFSPAFNNNCSHEGMSRPHRKGSSCTDKNGNCAGKIAIAELKQQLQLYRAGSGRAVRVAGGRGRDAEGDLQGPAYCSPQRFSMEGISSILQTGIRHTFGSGTADKQYLNTVIPYEKKGSPPSVEDLQMLTNILFAMKEGNEKVPTLLTDYILKGNEGRLRRPHDCPTLRRKKGPGCTSHTAELTSC